MADVIRNCVGCRKRHPTSALLRLQVNEAGVLCPVTAGAPGHRSAWVCPAPACVRRIQRNPKGLHRALRRKPAPQVAGLQERLVAHLDAQAARLVSRSHRDGLVVSGRQRLVAAEGLVVLVVAEDGSAESLRQIREAHETLVCSEIGLDRRAIGALIGKKERAVLGVRHGRSGELLRECLQRRALLS